MGSLSAMNALRRAVQNATMRYMLHGTFIGNSEQKTNPNTEAVRTQLHKNEFEAEWKTLDGTDTTHYDDALFMYTMNATLFALLFGAAFRGEDTRWRTVNRDLKNAVMDTTTTEESIITYPFVLSKTAANMSWHVDGGVSGGTDLVAYFVLGPADAISIIRVFGIDRPTLYSKQAIDPDTPNELTLRRRLSAFDNQLDVNAIENDGKHSVHRLSTLPAEVVALMHSDHILATHIDCICCWQICASVGDVVVFDGSQLHSVHNVISASRRPQIALAVNFRHTVERLERKGLSNRPRIRMSDETVRCDACGIILDDERGNSVRPSQECIRRCDTWACLPCANKYPPSQWLCRRHVHT